jgi:hypothetical protein
MTVRPVVLGRQLHSVCRRERTRCHTEDRETVNHRCLISNHFSEDSGVQLTFSLNERVF